MSKHTEYLIVGQGICGTFLSWYLHRSGASFNVIDHLDPSTSSRVAAGVINPVTGRRIVKTWMIDTLLPFALSAYEELGRALEIETIAQKNIVDLFPSAQMRVAFRDRLNEDDEYLVLHEDDHHFDKFFKYNFGSGEITPAYTVFIQPMLTAWRRWLTTQHLLLEEKFEDELLQITDSGIRYKDITAEKIIFCDGVSSANNSLFKNLPFALNKGEALIFRADELPDNFIYKKAITIVPLKDNYFWAGSSHDWNITDHQPTAVFREKTTRQLQQWLNIPFTVEDHIAAIRPATLERRPFVGMHPHYPRVGIFNGMGTKGCSLAPYFANQFVNYFTLNAEILPEADVKRFTRILQPNK